MRRSRCSPPDGAREARTDAAGRFEFRGVPAGTFQVVVSAQDHARYEVTEKVAPASAPR